MLTITVIITTTTTTTKFCVENTFSAWITVNVVLTS